MGVDSQSEVYYDMSSSSSHSVKVKRMFWQMTLNQRCSQAQTIVVETNGAHKDFIKKLKRKFEKDERTIGWLHEYIDDHFKTDEYDYDDIEERIKWNCGTNSGRATVYWMEKLTITLP